jgi:protein-S-isoprenylcysteine O-methyltransferase Ste14
MNMNRDRLSSWVGFLVFGGFAVDTYRNAPDVPLFALVLTLQPAVAAAAFLLRAPVVRQAAGSRSRVVALITTFQYPLAAWLLGVTAPGLLVPTGRVQVAATGLGMSVVGLSIATMALWQMRRGFAIDAQARVLVTTGAFEYARHPMYAAYAFSNLGLLVAFFSIPHLVFFLVWLGLVLLRIRYEEATLGAAFPEYEAYRRRVGIFAPRLQVAKRGAGGGACEAGDHPAKPVEKV